MFKRIILAGVAGTALIAAAPPINVPGAQTLSESDKAIGAKANASETAQFGGPYAGSQAAYVTRIGQKVAAQSGIANPQTDMKFTLLNSPVENAFAIPGGYVYVTRNLLALMNNEAELAFVLGHETGHIAAHHSDQRNKVVQRDSMLGTLGQVLLGAVVGKGAVGQMIGKFGSAGINRLVVGHVMSHSRGEEYEADDLGLTYMAKAGFDAGSASGILTGLAAQSDLEGKLTGNVRNTPSWALSHPEPAARAVRSLQRARELGIGAGSKNADAFLLALNGMIYDDDPKQGVIEGSSFKFPVGKFQFTAPAGYGISNGTDAVTISPLASQGSGNARFEGGPYKGDLAAYTNALFTAMGGGGQAVTVTGTKGTLGGMDSYSAKAVAKDSDGTAMDVTVTAFTYAPGVIYSFTVLQPQGQGLGDLAPLVASFRKMSVAEAAAIKSRVISVVTVGKGDTVASMAARMAYPTMQAERFRVLNGLAADATTLPPGRKVKLVVLGK